MASDNRLVSLDALRGLTIMGMIIVNNPADWSAAYPPLQHAEWIGCTPTDLVFPFFLFITGFSLFLSTQARIRKGASRKQLFTHLIKRSGIIFLIGLILNAFPFNNLPELRIPGVLQRIALVNMFCGTLLLYGSKKVSMIIGSAILVGYWILLCFIPSPLSSEPTLAYETNWVAWLDQLVLGKHTWSVMPLMDPEGIISTFPAVVTGLLGIGAARLFAEKNDKNQKTIILFVTGFILTAAGLAWSSIFPMIKKMWTSSYVLYTAGLASMTLGLMHYLLDQPGKEKKVRLLLAFGMNPLALYVGSELLIMIIWLLPFFGPEGLTLNTWFFRTLTGTGVSALNASLIWAVLYLAIWSLVASFLYKRKIIIKV